MDSLDTHTLAGWKPLSSESDLSTLGEGSIIVMPVAVGTQPRIATVTQAVGHDGLVLEVTGIEGTFPLAEAIGGHALQVFEAEVEYMNDAPHITDTEPEGSHWYRYVTQWRIENVETDETV